jgi:long-chain acyl-CoA synthetase
MDAAGFFFIVDRKDDLIITTGFNVYPSEVERVLESYEGVKTAAVVGQPDRIRGQVIVGYAVPAENKTIDKAGLLEHCRRHLPSHKIPKILRVVDEIPRSPVGKPLKKLLRRSEAPGPVPEPGK